MDKVIDEVEESMEKDLGCSCGLTLCGVQNIHQGSCLIFYNSLEGFAAAPKANIPQRPQGLPSHMQPTRPVISKET